jgi:hypothetical protein
VSEDKKEDKVITIHKGLLADFGEDGVYLIENPGFPSINHWTFLDFEDIEKLIKEYKKWKEGGE